MNGSFCNLCALGLGWCYISSLHCADELQQERNNRPQLRSCIVGSGYVSVSKRFSPSISLAVYLLIKRLKGAISEGLKTRAITEHVDRNRFFSYC